jgi:hypothetical protein
MSGLTLNRLVFSWSNTTLTLNLGPLTNTADGRATIPKIRVQPDTLLNSTQVPGNGCHLACVQAVSRDTS